MLRYATGLPVSIADGPLSCVAMAWSALEEMKKLSMFCPVWARLNKRPSSRVGN